MVMSAWDERRAKEARIFDTVTNPLKERLAKLEDAAENVVVAFILGGNVAKAIATLRERLEDAA